MRERKCDEGDSQDADEVSHSEPIFDIGCDAPRQDGIPSSMRIFAVLLKILSKRRQRRDPVDKLRLRIDQQLQVYVDRLAFFGQPTQHASGAAVWASPHACAAAPA